METVYALGNNEFAPYLWWSNFLRFAQIASRWLRSLSMDQGAVGFPRQSQPSPSSTLTVTGIILWRHWWNFQSTPTTRRIIQSRSHGNNAIAISFRTNLWFMDCWGLLVVNVFVCMELSPDAFIGSRCPENVGFGAERYTCVSVLEFIDLSNFSDNFASRINEDFLSSWGEYDDVHLSRMDKSPRDFASLMFGIVQEVRFDGW